MALCAGLCRKAGKERYKADHDFDTSALDRITVHKLNTSIPENRSEIISKLITVIKCKVPTVQSVIFLGISPGNDPIVFLLILTANDELRQAQSLGSTIEESCIGVAQVTALVHHASAMFTGVGNNNLFFNSALNCPVVYLSGDMLMPIPKPFALFKRDEGTLNWERWRGQAHDFLSGADYYLKNKAYGAALFSLHQCTECLLIALVRAILGYRINNHNLSRLLFISRMFTEALLEIYSLADAEDARLFDLLKQAYINIRYKDSFEADEKDVEGLYRVTKQFVAVAEKVYDLHLLNNPPSFIIR